MATTTARDADVHVSPGPGGDLPLARAVLARLLARGELDHAFVEWIRQRVPADETAGAIKSLVEAFAAHREAGQSFRQWVESTGTETLVELCGPHETDYEDPCLHDAKQSWYPFAGEDEPAVGGVPSDD